MYTELHAHSHFSFLDGASAPEALAARAAELGMDALAVTDHQGLYGAVKHRNACREAGIRPIYGAAVTLNGDGWTEGRRHPAQCTLAGATSDLTDTRLSIYSGYPTGGGAS